MACRGWAGEVARRVGRRPTTKQLWWEGSRTDNTQDQLETVTRNTTLWKEYTYDDDGRTTQIEEYGIDITSFDYDEADRITQISHPDSTVDSYSYNGLDTRLGKTEDAIATDFNRAGPGVTDSVLSDSNATYTPGISEHRGGDTTYIHSGMKNAAFQTDDTKAVAATREYDAFGQALGTSGSWKGPFGYAGALGYQSQDRSGYMLLGHRYYDPSIGRFLTRDPARIGDNWYGYCDNNPLSAADPSGLESHDPVVVGVDSEFKGEVIAIGETDITPDSHAYAIVRPGQQTHPGMDVDYIFIIYPDGRVSFHFLMGHAAAGDGIDELQYVDIDKDGNIHASFPICGKIAFYLSSTVRDNVMDGLRIKIILRRRPFKKQFDAAPVPVATGNNELPLQQQSQNHGTPHNPVMD